MRRELDDLRTAREKERDRRRPEDEEEIRRLKARCAELESEREAGEGSAVCYILNNSSMAN